MELQARELRIGNWVDLGGGRNLRQIKDEELGCLNLNPIPLTEEWLKRGGISHNGDQYLECDVWSNDRPELAFLVRNSNVIGLLIYGHIKYLGIPPMLHRIQNLYFALTGEELEFTHDAND